MTSKIRPYTIVLHKLEKAGLRPTKQRLALAKILHDKGNCHITAESLQMMACAINIKISLATIYNTLHQFKDAGILKEVIVEAGRSYFDTNIEQHYHFFNQTTNQLSDIPNGAITINNSAIIPDGTSLSSIDIVIRVA